MTINSQERLNQICDQIFLTELARQACEPFNQKWLKSDCDDWANSIQYSLKIKGIEVCVKAHLDKNDRAIASILVGNYRIDNNCFHSKKISFSLWKKGSYLNDFVNRLGVGEMMEHVEKILTVRNKKQAFLEEVECKKDVFKRFLPFNDGYKGMGHLYADCKNCYFELEQVHSDRATLTVRADVDFLMKLSACVQQLLAEA